MKEIHIHNRSDGNLLSIKTVENIYGDKRYIQRILENLLETTALVIIEARRPVYLVESSVDTINNISTQVENLKIFKNYSSLSFTYTKRENNIDFINACISIWFEYEQAGFTFLINENDFDIKLKKNLGNNFVSRTSTVDITQCFVMFKGIEEDVLWIEKSCSLSFDNVIKEGVIKRI